MSPSTQRVGAALGLAVATTAVAAAAGLVAQRRAARAILRRPDPEAHEDLDERFGQARSIRTEDGVVLAAEVVERPGAGDLTLVFSHGYGLDSSTFHYQFRDLQDLGRLVRWDQRGHGESSMPVEADGFSIEHLGRDLERILEELAPSGPVVLVSHSMGGMETFELARIRPDLFGDRIIGAVLLATAVDEGEVHDPLVIAGPIGRLLRQVGPGLADLLAPRPEIVERALQLADDVVVVLTEHYGFGSTAPPSFVEHTKKMHARTPLHVLVGMLPTFENVDLSAHIGPLQRTEVVIVVGETDRMTPPSLSRRLLGLLPGADLVTLADTGHMLMMERYPEVNQQIRDLVQRVRRAAA